MKTDNSTTELDPLEAEMLKQAEAYDSDAEVSMEEIDKLTVDDEEPETDKKTTPDDGDSHSDDDGDELDADGNPIQKEEQTDAAKKLAEEEAAKKLEEEKGKLTDKQASDYAKAREKREKERERLSKSWQDLDAEKERVRTTEAEFAKREAELAEREKALKTPRYTAEDYDSVAKALEAKGEDQMAAQARQKAEALRAGKGDQLVQSLESQKKQQEEFIATWNAHFETAKKETPELADLKSELSQAVQANLKEVPMLSYMPDGITWAVKLAKMQSSARQADTLREELKTAQKEIERLHELTSTDGGGHQRRPKPKTFEDMTLAEQEAELERKATEFDRS